MKRDSIIDEGRKKLFDFEYPIDQNYKKEFETKFIRHFYFREIGFETEGRFKFELETWLQQYMPYWNKIIESTNLEYNPLYNIDYKREMSQDKEQNQVDERKINTTVNNESEGRSNASANSESKTDGTASETEKNKNLREDTPDDRLAIINDDNIIQSASEIKQDDNKRNSTNSAESESSSTSNTTANSSSDTTANNKDDFKSDKDEKLTLADHVFGKQGVVTYPEMIMKHREAILKIEEMIFKEMSELFMLVY